MVHNIWNYTLLSVGSNNICVSNIALALLLSALGFKYSKTVSLNLKRYLRSKMAHDKDAANALEKIISYAIFAIYIISILEIANIPLSSFAFIGGALALGIGLGGQNLMSSFISSLIIMVERPIKIGDVVEIDGVTGTVTSIGARCVSLTSFSNVEILVPNSKVMQNLLINWTFADNIICSSAILRIAKSSSLEADYVIDKTIALLKATLGIHETPTPTVYLINISMTHHIYKLSFNCDLVGINTIESIQNVVNLKLVELLKDKEFEIEHLKLVDIKDKDKKDS